MAHTEHGGDVSQRGPADYLDPLAPVSSQLQQLIALMELVFDEDSEQFLEDLTASVRAMPPDERFRRSHEVLRTHVTDRFGSPDAFAARFPDSDIEELPAVLEQLFDRVLNDVLEGVLFRREPKEHLILAALFQTLGYGIRRLEETDEQAARNSITSALLAVLSRLHDLLDDPPQSLPEDAIRDTAYALHFLTVDDSDQEFPNPDAMTDREIEQELVEFGAVIAYARLTISLSRGAELAGVGPDEFRELLDSYGIEPRLGPRSLAELSDSDLDG